MRLVSFDVYSNGQGRKWNRNDSSCLGINLRRHIGAEWEVGQESKRSKVAIVEHTIYSFLMGDDGDGTVTLETALQAGFTSKVCMPVVLSIQVIVLAMTDS